MDRLDIKRYFYENRKMILRRTLTVLYVVFVVALVFTVGAVGVAAGVVSAMVKNEKVRSRDDFKRDLDSLFQNSYAYFHTKNDQGQPIRIGTFRSDGEMRKLITSVNDVNQDLVDAFISIEDRDFYDHDGIVPRSLIRAAFQQLTRSDVTTGGSTITQQLVKNVILKDFDKDLERKAKEIVLAIRLDSMFEKNDILVYYMNSVYFGSGANKQNLYGVQAAAKGLFNKDPKELNLAQSAYIAGMVQRPNSLNPFGGEENLKRGRKRMELVLKAMKENGKITENEYQQALKFDIKGSLAKPEQFNDSYKHYPFIMYALEEEAAEILMEKDGLSIEELSKQGRYRSTLIEYVRKVRTRGYHVYSTVDKNMYDAVNQAATKNLRFHTRTYKGVKDHEQLGAVIMDNKSGAVLAFVSGTNDSNNKDHALDAVNQPGSSIKPLLVYGPALEEGFISPNTMVLDERIPRADGSGFYENANDKYAGPVSVRTALKYSYNIPAIKIFNRMGHDTGFDYLRKLKIPPHPNDGESAAIGGATNGYTVEKMTAAFATFANQGKYNEPYLVEKIVDASGQVVYEHKNNPETIFSPQTAYQVTDILRDVVKGGTAVYIGSRITGYDLAGKTGTTSDDRDLWFIGYTPQITIGVWGGYDYNFRMSHNDKFTKQAWVNIFKAAAEANPAYFNMSARFENPGGYGKQVSCLECDRIKKYKDDEKKKEEQKKKEDEQKKRRRNKPGDLPPGNNPPPGTNPPTGPEPPTDPGDDGNPGDNKPPWFPPPRDDQQETR